MNAVRTLLIALAICPASIQADNVASSVAVNPIRKVVTMLQAMQKKVAAEGEKETQLFEKFMCYCKNGGEDLGKSIEAAETKIPQVSSDIKEAEAKSAQLKEDIKQAQMDRGAAKEAIASATALREKEAAAYAKESSEVGADLAALKKAVAAIEAGMGSAFLQTGAADVLKRLVQQKQDMQDSDRQEVSAFLQGTQTDGYAPASGEITGILKEMGDEFTRTLTEGKAAEDAAIAAFESLVASKTKEINALQAALESKMSRSGELSVEIVQMKNDLDDTSAALAEDKAFLADLEKNCATKSGEWEEIKKTRNEELLALADTIKVLNDDDALELFKKTLPGASASFMQVSVSSATARAQALAAIHQVSKGNPQLDFIALAIQGKKIGFDKVIKMIDDMMATLKTEQDDDDHKKEYCEKQFDLSDDKKKGLEHDVSDTETAIEDTKESIASVSSEIEALQDAIKKLDKAVTEATEQRKEENEDFTELMASDSAAKELLNFAKNRLNKFYNPKLYKAPAKRTLSEDEQLTLSMGGTLAPTAAPGGIAGTGIAVMAQIRAHGGQPEAPGPYAKKSEESTGVIAMVDLIIKDLDKEMTEAQTSEKDAQGDYETMMKNSAGKRASDSKSLANKESTLADMQADLESHHETLTSKTKELMATEQYIGSLHAECDWLIQYFDVRKEARAGEVDALGKAKAVLKGADYSLVQMKSRKFLQSK